MYGKFKIGEPEMCPCNTDIMTTERLPQHCQIHDALRLTGRQTDTIDGQALWHFGGAEEEQLLSCRRLATPSSKILQRRSARTGLPGVSTECD